MKKHLSSLARAALLRRHPIRFRGPRLPAKPRWLSTRDTHGSQIRPHQQPRAHRSAGVPGEPRHRRRGCSPDPRPENFISVRVFFLFSSCGSNAPRRGARLRSLFSRMSRTPSHVRHSFVTRAPSVGATELEGCRRAFIPRGPRAYRRRRRKTRRSARTRANRIHFFISPRARSPFFSFCSFAARARAVCVSCRF